MKKRPASGQSNRKVSFTIIPLAKPTNEVDSRHLQGSSAAQTVGSLSACM
jgi:hypothetical protein